MPDRRVHYILSSHWDREWYQSFQDYRYRLVEMLENVIAGLEDGRLAGPFQTDGQSILLEDYIEVHPARRILIERLAKQRKLLIGPWYVLPDEFLVSGESLVRNLRLGRRVARDLGGEPSDAGFVCDLFGHVSQLPQILAGFGIEAGLIWRGTNDPGTRLIRWRGADGTEMICYRFGKHGYCRYAMEVRQAAPPTEVFAADPPRSNANLDEALDRFISEEVTATPAPAPLLLFDGGDHQGWDEQAYEVLRQRLGRGEGGIEIVHSCLDDYLAELKAHADKIDTVIEGELREPGRDSIERDNQWLIPGVLSSRVPLKQANARCQTLLCHWAEPMSLLAHTLLSRAYPTGFLEVAWRWLIKNHPHDSICGCSIDQVHRDMAFRFSQCEQIGGRLTAEAADALAAHVEGDLAGDELRATVFNPLPEPLEQTVELTLPIPTHWPQYPSHANVLHEPMFHIHDATGRALPVQKLGLTWNRTRFRLFPARFPQTYRVHEVRISLPLSIPPMGYTTLKVSAGNPARHERVELRRSLATGPGSMENENLAVAVEPGGTLTLTDKRTGAEYRHLLTYEDTADAGDGWYHGQVVGDETHHAAAGRVSVARVADGPNLTTLRLQTVMSLPARFEQGDNWRRTERLVEMPIDTYVSLRPGATHLEVETVFDNTVDDHRLRVLLPSGTGGAKTYLADSAFDVVERPIALRRDNHLYREPEVETKPQQSWTAVSDGRRGLAVVSEGLHESGVLDQPDRPIALTLLRATRTTIFTDGEPDGELRQRLRFRFWIQPIADAIQPAALCKLAQRLACGVRSSFLHAKDLAEIRHGDTRLPARAGFLSIDGDVVMTAFEQHLARHELRLFNPSQEETSVVIRWPKEMPEAGVPEYCQPVDFDGNPSGARFKVDHRRCVFTVAPKKIMTLRLLPVRLQIGQV